MSLLISHTAYIPAVGFRSGRTYGAVLGVETETAVLARNGTVPGSITSTAETGIGHIHGFAAMRINSHRPTPFSCIRPPCVFRQACPHDEQFAQVGYAVAARCYAGRLVPYPIMIVLPIPTI